MVLVPKSPMCLMHLTFRLGAGRRQMGRGRQVGAAALALGARGVWMGSAFLTAPEYDLGVRAGAGASVIRRACWRRRPADTVRRRILHRQARPIAQEPLDRRLGCRRRTLGGDILVSEAHQRMSESSDPTTVPRCRSGRWWVGVDKMNRSPTSSPTWSPGSRTAAKRLEALSARADHCAPARGYGRSRHGWGFDRVDAAPNSSDSRTTRCWPRCVAGPAGGAPPGPADRTDAHLDGRCRRRRHRSAQRVAWPRRSSIWFPTTKWPAGCAPIPDRLAGVATVDLDRAMDAVGDCAGGWAMTASVAGGVVHGSWRPLPPTDRRFPYPLFRREEESVCRSVRRSGTPVRCGHRRPSDHSVHRRSGAGLSGARDRCGHVGYPRTRGDGGRRPQARKRLHRHVHYASAVRLPAELVAFLKTGTGQRKVLFSGPELSDDGARAVLSPARRTRAQRGGQARLPAR